MLTHHHSVCQPLIPTTFTFLLLLFLCLICSEMITLLIRPMRQLHPHLFHRVACPLSTADASITAAAAPASYVPQSAPCQPHPPLAALQGCITLVPARSILSISWSSVPSDLPRRPADIPTPDRHHRIRPAPHRLETWQHGRFILFSPSLIIFQDGPLPPPLY